MDSGAKSDTALARKLAIARDDQHSNPRSVLRALRLALARVSEDVCGLSMTVIAAAQSQQSQDDLADSLPPDRLYLLLAGPGAFLAAIAIDRACVQSI
ncbi:MAG: flagellar motor switch protein FliM, partial [Pseudomonadota bacterium]